MEIEKRETRVRGRHQNAKEAETKNIGINELNEEEHEKAHTRRTRGRRKGVPFRSGGWIRSEGTVEGCEVGKGSNRSASIM